MLHASPTNSKRPKIFTFAQLTVSDDELSVDNDSTSAALTPTALEVHAEETRRELDTHRERLRQRSAAHLEAERYRASEESELQRTVSKLMKELSQAQDAVQLEVAKRSQIERNFRALQAEHRTTLDELATLKRRESLHGAASPLLSPNIPGSPGALPLIRVDGPGVKPVASFRLVKKPSTSVQTQQHAATLALFCEAESISRAALVDLAAISLRSMHSLWGQLKLLYVQCAGHELSYIVQLEASERTALATHEAKMRYKSMIRVKVQESEELHRQIVHQRALILSFNKTETARRLQDELDDGLPVPVAAPPPPKCPPWYPAGTSSVNYHSPHRQRSPSVPSRSCTPSRPASAAQSLTSIPNYSHVPPKVSTGRERSQSPSASKLARSRGGYQTNEPSPNMSPPTPHYRPVQQHRRTSVSSPQHAAQKPAHASSKISSVKRTIDTMEALLAELQSWKSSGR